MKALKGSDWNADWMVVIAWGMSGSVSRTISIAGDIERWMKRSEGELRDELGSIKTVIGGNSRIDGCRR
jgi:hypothetical protein